MNPKLKEMEELLIAAYRIEPSRERAYMIGMIHGRCYEITGSRDDAYSVEWDRVEKALREVPARAI